MFNVYSHITYKKNIFFKDKRFEVHKVILASCSDYFRSMFTSGMRETTQHEIELKGVTSRGLEKVIEILYTAHSRFDSHADMFDTLAAATHLQCLMVIDFCERIFLAQLTCQNFNYFIHMAKLIDEFIAANLAEIINQQQRNTTRSFKTRYINPNF